MTAVKAIRELGEIPPDSRLSRWLDTPEFVQDVFTNTADAPAALTAFLAQAGYQIDQQIDSPQVFGSCRGVGYHQDYQDTVVWTLRLPRADRHRLTVGEDSVLLREGQVLVFDAWTRHRLATRDRGFWAVFSAYVRPM